MIDPVDQTLIQQCLKQDKEAWDTFVRRFSAPVYDAVFRTLQRYHYKDCKDAATDVHQDVFLHLLEDQGHALAIFQGRNGCQLKHYVRTIAVRLTVDFLRKQRPTIEYDDDCEVMGQKMGAFFGRDPEESGESGQHDDEKYRYQRLIAVLNPREQELCRLFFLERNSVILIAKRLGISSENVYVRKNRLLAKLRAAVALIEKEERKEEKIHVRE